MITFSFNGETKNWVRIMRDEARWMTALISRPTHIIPHRHGSVIGNHRLLPRVMQIPVGIHHSGFEDLQKKKIELSEWLVTQSEGELAFSDEPNIIYRAVLSTPLGNIVESPNFTTGVLEFTCYDPFRYSDMVNSFNSANNVISTTYHGTARTDEWIVTSTINQTTNVFWIEHQGNRIQLNFNFQAGNTVLIDARRRLIVINGQNALATFDFQNSQWFEIGETSTVVVSGNQPFALQFRARFY